MINHTLRLADIMSGGRRLHSVRVESMHNI